MWEAIEQHAVIFPREELPFVASTDPARSGRCEGGAVKFGPDRRIRKSEEFRDVQSKGRRFVSENFVFVVAPAKVPEALPRLGITVSKRVGNSVRRNRIKRIVRAAFQLENGLVPRGYDLVVICRRDESHLKRKDVVDQFAKSAKKLYRDRKSSLDPRPP